MTKPRKLAKPGDLTAREALAKVRTLYASAPHGTFVGTTEDGRPCVGWFTASRRVFRFAGATYTEAFRNAEVWAENPQNAWRVPR